MKRYIKLIKTYLKPLKGDQSPQNPQLFQLKLQSTKLTFLTQKKYNKFCKNLSKKMQANLKLLEEKHIEEKH